jgi:hypothetical protein
MRSKPHRGTPVQVLELAAELRAQLRPQQLREERVISVPHPVLVQRRQQRAAMLEAGKHPLSVDPPVSASASSPHTVSTIDVRSRNSRRSAGWRASTSLSR